jgi:hypothetical protein
MRSILENGPFKDEPDFLIRYPLSSQSATFSTKLKTLQKTEAPNLRENDPFPYLFDGRYMSKDHETSLEGIPPDLLVGGNMLAIKTNVFLYDSCKGRLTRSAGILLSIRTVLFLGDGDCSLPVASTQSSQKRQGEHLVSPRKNKKVGELAVLGD